MSSFTSSLFNLLLDYSILSSFDGNVSSPSSRRNLDSKQIGLHQHCQLEAHKRTQLFFFPWLIMDIIRLIVVPLPSPFLYSHLILVIALLHIYTWIFINSSFSFCLHLSIKKLSLKAKWLSHAMFYEDFFKDHGYITEQHYRKYLSFEVKLSSL